MQVPYHSALKVERLEQSITRIAQLIEVAVRINLVAAGAIECPQPDCAKQIRQEARGCAEQIIYSALREYRPDLFIDRPVGKFGTPEGLLERLLPGEPWFAILGHDRYGPRAIQDYAGRRAPGGGPGAPGRPPEGLRGLAGRPPAAGHGAHRAAARDGQLVL